MFADLMSLERTDETTFEAPAAPDKGERMFGGQFLAQGLRAAAQTLPDALRPDGRAPHSLHAYFLRPGDVHHPVTITVEPVRDGRSFSSRSVVATQHGKIRFQMLASFQVPVESPEYQGHAMPEVPPPDAVTTTYDDFTLSLLGADGWHGSDRPVEIRYVNPPTAPRGAPVTEHQLMWIRIRGTLGRDPVVHAAGLAYLSDATLVDHVMLPHGMRWQDADFAGASLDHAMWFHRSAPADEWLLFDQRVEATGGGRGLGAGRLFSRDGALVATCLQEGLMRWAGNSA